MKCLDSLPPSIRVAALLNTGLSVRDIAEETGMSKSALQRLKRKKEQDMRP